MSESRLPAGSTLEIMPGIWVPHPHAAVALPGEDPVSADAIHEKLSDLAINAAASADSDGVPVAVVTQEPLSEDVRVRTPAIVEGEQK